MRRLWLVAKRYASGKDLGPEVRDDLEAVGFLIIQEDEFYYQVLPPEQWVIETWGQNSTIRDKSGTVRFTMWEKKDWWDRAAILKKVV